MPHPRPRICLSMIVKNERAVIHRCLDALKPLIDHWVIVDTGSDDGTQQLIRSVMQGIPGTLHERPWRDFAHNRSEALQLARQQGDYVFVIDADETLEWPAQYVLPTLDADAYSLDMHYGDMRYHRVCLLSTKLDWQYRGVLHEYLEADGLQRSAHLDVPWVRVRAEGARSLNPRKFHEDAAVLERALVDEPDNARYRFYLAQSYRDAGEPALALQHYRQRLAMPGWDEETWYAQWQIAVLLERVAASPADICQAYLAAYQLRPKRAEPLVDLARFHRLRGEYALALLYAQQAALMPLPDDRLFIQQSHYQWQALDEVGISAYYVGTRAALQAGAAAVDRLIGNADVPADQRARIAANRGFYPQP